MRKERGLSQISIDFETLPTNTDVFIDFEKTYIKNRKAITYIKTLRWKVSLHCNICIIAEKPSSYISGALQEDVDVLKADIVYVTKEEGEIYSGYE